MTGPEPRWKRDQQARRAARNARPEPAAPDAAVDPPNAKPAFDKVGFIAVISVVVIFALALFIWRPFSNDDDGDPAPAGSSAPAAVSYFPATCSTWLNGQSGDARQSQAGRYLDDNLPGHSFGDTQAFTLLITQACNSYGTGETPQHIADVSLASFKAGN